MPILQSDIAGASVLGATGLTGQTGATGSTGVQGASGSGATGVGYFGLTSSTSIAIGTGSKVFTTNLTATATAFAVGQRVRVASTSTPVNYMEGLIASFSGTTLTVTVDWTGGAGTIASWTITAAGQLGATGPGGGVTVVDDNTSPEVQYPAMARVISGSMSTGYVTSDKLYFQPTTGTLSATTFNSLSDESQKTNIKIINDALNIIENLDGITFDWKDKSGSSAGLLSQQVEKHLPQLVDEYQGLKSLNYDGVIGILVEAVKTLSQKVKDLESK